MLPGCGRRPHQADLSLRNKGERGLCIGVLVGHTVLPGEGEGASVERFGGVELFVVEQYTCPGDQNLTKGRRLNGVCELLGLGEFFVGLCGLLEIAIRGALIQGFADGDVRGRERRREVTLQYSQSLLGSRTRDENLRFQDAEAPVPLRADVGIFLRGAIDISKRTVQVALHVLSQNAFFGGLGIASRPASAQ